MDQNDINILADIDLYEILESSKEDDIQIIKKRYRKLILEHHPDKNPQHEDKFQLINIAYNVISDDILRELYLGARNLKIGADFVLLKQHFQNSEKIIYEKDFKTLNAELDKKHNITNLIDTPIDIKEIQSKITDYNLLGEKIKEEIDNSKIKTISDLNSHFANINRENKVSNEIVEVNNSLMLNNSISAFDNLYNIDPSEIESSFELHKTGTFIDDNSTLEERMTKYNSYTEELEKLKTKKILNV